MAIFNIATLYLQTCKYDVRITSLLAQGDHFPDHMKFPDFSLTFPVEASKDYLVSSVY